MTSGNSATKPHHHHRRAHEKKFSDFVAAVENGEVAAVVIEGHRIHGQLRNHHRFTTYAPKDPDLIRRLLEKKVEIAARPAREPRALAVLFQWLPWLLLLGVGVFLLRR
jgi:cell division protease FtsH